MDILLFERMRIIRGGAGKVIFKLRLPKLEGEENICFNSFYSSLASAYLEAAEAIANASAADVRFTVSFKADERERKIRKIRKGTMDKSLHPLVVIRRSAVIINGESERFCVVTDVYDPCLDIFVK